MTVCYQNVISAIIINVTKKSCTIFSATLSLSQSAGNILLYSAQLQQIFASFKNAFGKMSEKNEKMKIMSHTGIKLSQEERTAIMNIIDHMSTRNVYTGMIMVEDNGGGNVSTTLASNVDADTKRELVYCFFGNVLQENHPSPEKVASVMQRIQEISNQYLINPQ